jgi:hypothetical protein
VNFWGIEIEGKRYAFGAYGRRHLVSFANDRAYGKPNTLQVADSRVIGRKKSSRNQLNLNIFKAHILPLTLKPTANFSPH